MPSTAGSVMLRAANHLNDPNQLKYTNTVLLPFVNMALERLEEELGVYEISAFKKTSIPIDVDAGDTQLTQMPVDFVEPIRLLERNRDSSEDWNEIREVAELDNNIDDATTIVQWARRNNAIFINAPTQDREVILEYIGTVTSATGALTTIDIEASRRFLALETARCAARDLGNSATKMSLFENDIRDSLNNVVRRLQKGDQGAGGVRRKAYRGR